MTQEQVGRTCAPQIGHVSGCRHFFALVSETAWPAEKFGTHNKFSIMNYGADSRLTAEDKSDLKNLYQSAWKGELTRINGTPTTFRAPLPFPGSCAACPDSHRRSDGAGHMTGRLRFRGPG